LISIGTIGLIKGINSYDISKNIKLATYVARCIENEILMFLRGSKKSKAEVYLNEPIGKDKDDNEITLLEVLENDDRSIEDKIDLTLKTKTLYSKINDILTEREKNIIIMRYGLDGKKPRTQNAIAKMMNISRSYVSRIETKAVYKLGKEMQP
jgi:RNA polymerase sporulation-specific sigma factor